MRGGLGYLLKGKELSGRPGAPGGLAWAIGQQIDQLAHQEQRIANLEAELRRLKGPRLVVDNDDGPEAA